MLVGATLLIHSSQKSLGWFHGKGLQASSAGFEALGLRPGRLFVVVASLSEAAAALALLLGLLTPVGAAVGAATMIVAGFALQSATSTFWNAGGGGEYPYFISVTALVIAWTGPGDYAIDSVLRTNVPAYALIYNGGVWVFAAAVIVAILGSIPFIYFITRGRHRASRLDSPVR